MKILITGGAGFIGSNFIKFLLGEMYEKRIQIVNIDKLTYAGRGKNLEYSGLDKDKRYAFFQGDISDRGFVMDIFKTIKPDMVFNFAAESHVDRSIQNPTEFVSSNINGTINLLEASLGGLARFIQISTDEVYGSIMEGSFSESDRLNPSNPYSASKASAEHFVQAYHKTHNVPALITRSSNNYGPFQIPEKLIPLFITHLIDDKKVPLMWSENNPGLNTRDWIYVGDNCEAIWYVANHGKIGEVYNISGENELDNITMTHRILSYFKYGEEMIEKVPHRKGHDFRYSISGEKLAQLGFKHEPYDFKQRLEDTCRWYVQNQKWWRPLTK